MAKNTGKYRLSAEGRRGHNALCANLKLIHQVNDKEAGRQFEEGDIEGGTESMRVAAAAAADAKKYGCRWAS
jgi:hypothetical protein